MSDLKQYIKERSDKSPDFENLINYEYENLKIGGIIKELRMKNGMTQEKLAEKMHTTKSSISRLENHVGNVRLATLEKVAQALNKKLTINFK